jgi:hypothetical protein
MRKKAFNIEFVTDEIRTKNFKNSEAYKYEAVITTLSKSFKLFKVSKIQRITKDGAVNLLGSYYLTSYPLANKKDDTWKDPITLCSNNFLQLLGKTIESYLTSSMQENAGTH